MSITYRLNDWNKKPWKPSVDTLEQPFRTKSKPIVYNLRQNSIYEDAENSKHKDKRNVLERFQELRKKMASRANQRRKRIAIESITVDLVKSSKNGGQIASEQLSCERIMSHINQKTQAIHRSKLINSQCGSETSRLPTRTFRPYKENDNARIIFNAGGRIIEYAPEVKKDVRQAEQHRLPTQQLRATFYDNISQERVAEKRNTDHHQRSTPRRRRVYSVAPNHKGRQALPRKSARQGFMQDIQPWESQFVTENQAGL